MYSALFDGMILASMVISVTPPFAMKTISLPDSPQIAVNHVSTVDMLMSRDSMIIYILDLW